MIRSNEYCTWLTSTNGGTSPFTYAWYVDNVLQSESYSSFNFGGQASPFNLEVRVTDAGGILRIGGMSVVISETAEYCLQ